MTDPLSISASIAGLITLADSAFRRTFKYVKAAKDAPKEISALSSELGVLYGLLNRLHLLSHQLEGESFDSAVQGHHLHSCHLTLEKVKVILDKHDTSSLEDQTMQKLKKRLKWQFSISDAKSLITEIERHKSTISLALNADGMSGLLLALSRQTDVSNNMQDIKRELQQRRETETRIAIDGERQRALDAIGPFEPHRNHEMGLRVRHPATGLWFTEGDDFNTWLNTSGAKLWLYGIPGAGKTVLASSIIQEALAKTSRHVALAYFYCDYKDLAMQQPTNILGSLARQLATQDEQSFEKLQAFYTKNASVSRGSTTYDPTELCELIVDMASFFDCTMIVVDALDECGTQTASVVNLLASLNHPGESNTVKTLFLSRDEIDTRELLNDYTPVAIAAQTRDLRLYVGAEIELRIRNKQLRIKDQTLRDHIMERLVDGAQGMFRWVVCQMDYLCELTNDAARRKALNSLPPTLNATYERILRKVNSSSKDVQKLVQRCLRWIVHSNGELSIAALCEAISINNNDTTLDREAVPEEDEILRRCSSLIRKSASASGFELAHYTVKEFLTGVNRDSDSEFGIYHIDPIYDDPALAITCLTYLSLYDFAGCGIADMEMLDQRATEFAFRKYAVTNWAHHARNYLTNADILSLAKKLLDPSKPNIFLSWAQEFVYWKLEDLADHSLLSGSNPLHYAAMLALPEVCSWLIGCGCDVDGDSDFGRPLHCALIGERILEGASHEGDWYSFFGQPFIGNLSTRQESTISVLLEAGANPNNSYHLYECRVSPLHLAVFIENRTLYRELIQHGATLDEGTVDLLRHWAKSDLNDTEELASIIDHFTALETLAPRFVASSPTRTIATDSSSSLRIAAEFGQLTVVKNILQDGKVFIDAVDESTGRTSLHCAAKGGHIEIVQRLLECGADCNAKDLKNKTSLHYSVRREGFQCLKLLLQQDIDIAARDLNGYSVWHSAAKRNNAQALSFLRDWVVNKNNLSSPEADGEMTPLNEGLDLKSHTGLTPLHVATGACALDAVRFLVDNGSDVGAVTANGSTVLHCLASSEARTLSCEVVGILLAKGADPCQPCMDGKTPLHSLTEWGSQFEETRLEVLQRLVHSATGLNQINAEGITVLHQVCHLDPLEEDSCLNFRTKALKSLLLNGADQQCLNQSGETAFQLVVDAWEVAARSPETSSPEFFETCAEMADLLLQVNALPPRHLLFLSIWHHFEKLADRLLVHSPEVDLIAYEVSGVTPLQAACLGGCSLNLLRKLLRSHKVQTNNRVRGSGLIRCACKSDDSRVLSTVTELLDSGLDPNECSLTFHFHQGQTALMIAAAAGNLRLLEVLLARGADPSAKDKEGETMLHHACRGSDISSVSFEVIVNNTREADINARGHEGKTALYYTASRGWTYPVSLLLLKKADMTIPDSRKGRLPIHIAAAFGEMDVVMELLDHGCPTEVKDKSGLTPELTAYKYGHFAVGTAIGSYAKEHVSGSNQTTAPKVAVDDEPDGPSKALRVAIEEGDLDLCQKLVEYGENLDSGFRSCLGCTPLLYSLHHARSEVSKYLVLQGASIAGETCDLWLTVGYTAFHYAARYGYLELLRELLKRPTEISLQRLNPNPIHLAIQYGHTECAQILIEHAEKGEKIPLIESRRPLVSREDLTATTSLHFAATYGNVKITELLLNSGDSSMCLDSSQQTPLHLAVAYGHTAIVKILLRAGASPHARDLYLATPCTLAASSNDLKSLKALVEAGGDLALTDVHYNTLLHRAVRSKAYTVALYIMTKTTSYKLQSEDVAGESVIVLMLRYGCPPLTTFLLNSELSPDAFRPGRCNVLTAATLNIDFPPKMLRVLLRRLPNGLLPILLTHRSLIGGTPLYAACTAAPPSSRIEKIQIFLDAGADIDYEGGDCGTPLMGACAAGRLSVVKLLVMKGANICYLKDGEVYSAFEMAKHFPEIRQWLLVGRYTDGPRLLTDGSSIRG